MSKKNKPILRYSQSVEQGGICKKIKLLVHEAQEAYNLLPRSKIIFSSRAFLSETAASPAETEEMIFEFLRDIAEAFPDICATIVVKNQSDRLGSEEYELMKAKIRAIFRAAVYGNFSLLCESAQTKQEYESFCASISKIFCELESEDREFNGYISKGVLISTPLSAICLSSCPADFLCVDLDQIIPLISGTKDKSLDFLKGDILSSVSKVLSDIFGDSKKKIAVFSSSLCPSACELAEACGACEIWSDNFKV